MVPGDKVADAESLAERMGGVLVVVQAADGQSVSVQAADGFECSLPIEALAPPPRHAAVRLLRRLSETAPPVMMKTQTAFKAPKVIRRYCTLLHYLPCAL